MKKNDQHSAGRNNDPGAYFKLLSDRISRDLADAVTTEFPPNLYNPMRYVLSSRGKRFRPILLIMSCESIGGTFEKAYNASLAIEILHNFTLVHDDIMDNDELRRGLMTVHKKWNSNIAILAGDGLIALAYRFLLKTKYGRLKQVIKIFSEAIINICEGQSIDKDMETVSNVHMNEYLDMIERKTAVLISISAELGGILGNGSALEINILRRFGFELGIAFQIQDDLLDIVSDEIVIGKDLGSDLSQGKKTFPIIMFLDCAMKQDIQFLSETMSNGNADAGAITRVKKMLQDYGIVEKTQHEVDKRVDAALACFNNAPATMFTNHLSYLAEVIRNRTF